MSVLQLSLNAARHLHLAAQGLLKSPAPRSPEMISFPPSSACRCCKSTPLILLPVALTWCCSAAWATIPLTGLMRRSAKGSSWSTGRTKPVFSAAQRFCPGASPHACPRKDGLEISSRVDGRARGKYCRADGAYPDKTDRFARRILNIREKAPAVGGRETAQTPPGRAVYRR